MAAGAIRPGPCQRRQNLLVEQPMKSISLKIVRRAGCEDLPLPAYQSAQAAGMDLVAAVDPFVLLMIGIEIEFRESLLHELDSAGSAFR